MRRQTVLWMLGTAATVLMNTAHVHANGTNVVAAIGEHVFLANDFRPARTGSQSNVTGLAKIQRDEELDPTLAWDVRQIADWALNVAMQQAATQLDINVSSDEQRVTLRKIYGDDNKVLNDLNDTMARLPAALREAIATPEQERQIYEKHLAAFMSYTTWRGHLTRYNTPEKIASLEKMARPSKADLYRPIPSLEKALLERKLRSKLTEGVTISETSIRREYALRYPSQAVPFDQVRESIEKDLLQREKERTWHSQLIDMVSKTPVVIYDKRIEARYHEWLRRAVDSVNSQ